MLRSIVRYWRVARGLVVCERGTMVVQVAILLAAMVGMAGLSVDMGRLVTTNSQAKAAADAAALAAATTLAAAVRAPGADPDNPAPVIAAIWDAARTGVVNRHNFATVGDNTGGDVQIVGIRLLTNLPELAGGSQTDPVDPYVTGDPWEAHFVEVRTQLLNQTNAFMPVVGTARTTDTSAVAVAGATQVLCNITPLWICNPAEQNGPGEIFEADEWRGRQVRLKSSAPGSAWSPGNFGLLDGLDGNGVPVVMEGMATVAPEACFRSDGVDLRPGQAIPVAHGLNTRFDMYGSGHVSRSNPNHRPALNVAKGFRYTNPSCNPTVLEPQAAMPRDANLVGTTERLGNGQWDCQTYWDANHPGVAPPPGCTNPSEITRYDLYRYEIDEDLVTVNGTPQCYTGPTPIPESPDRRIIYFAMINCSAGGLNGNKDDVPVAAFGRGFLTEPVAVPPAESEIFLEILDVVRPGADDGVLHEIVQLYR